MPAVAPDGWRSCMRSASDGWGPGPDIQRGAPTGGISSAACKRSGRVDVRPNWKEKAGMPDSWQARQSWEK
jgi:hypothetical protein